MPACLPVAYFTQLSHSGPYCFLVSVLLSFYVETEIFADDKLMLGYRCVNSELMCQNVNEQLCFVFLGQYVISLLTDKSCTYLNFETYKLQIVKETNNNTMTTLRAKV